MTRSTPIRAARLNESIGLLFVFGVEGQVRTCLRRACVAEVEGFVAGTVIGHNPAHRDVEALRIGDRRFVEADGADGFFIRLI
jgi:hypothetical protein